MEFFACLLQVDAATRSAVNQYLASCGRHTSLRYPFGNPISAESCHVPIIKQCEYLVADKSDGVRACFVACRVDGWCYSVLCDRTGKMYGLPVDADESIFNGTVLDSELIRLSSGLFQVVAFDTCAIAGNRSVEVLPLTERLEHMRQYVLPNMRFVQEFVSLTVKSMFTISDLRADRTSWDAYLAGLEYATDGQILTPNQEPPSIPGTASSIFKLKDCHTIDMTWSDGMLWFGDPKEMFPISSLGIAFDRAQFGGLLNDVVVELEPCRDKTGGVKRVNLLQERKDKDTPNSYLTVTRTLQSVADNITLESLLQ